MIRIEGNTFSLENDFIARSIVFDEGGLHTTSIFNKAAGKEYAKPAAPVEFMLRLQNKTLFGFKQRTRHILDGNISDRDYNLSLIGAESMAVSPGVERLKVSLLVAEIDVKVNVYYEIKRKFCGISKWLEVISGMNDLSINSIIFDVINACPGEFSDVDFYRQAGLTRLEPMFALAGAEDIIQIHNSKLEEGVFFGNSAPGPLKFFLCYPHWQETAISTGYNFESPPVNKYLNKGETFTTDRAMIFLYKGRADDDAVRNSFRDYIRSYLPVTADNGGFMYCTWLPFLKDINEPLLLDLIDRAADMGFNSFVLDDGWFVNGEWTVDKEKFPNGLKIISDKVRSRGMCFGLWFNIGTDYGNLGRNAHYSGINTDGSPKIFGLSGEIRQMCFASGHRELVAQKLTALAREYNVGYFKLDFSNIVSPYRMMQAGCCSTGHEYHRESGDSIIEQYAGLKYVRDEVKKVFPGLIVDFSFEAFGLDYPSIAALEYSELHHMSNMNTLRPHILNALKIRNTLYRYVTVMPPERLLGSLICLQNQNDIEHLLTALVGTPLVAGDLRKITPENLILIRRVTAAIQGIISQGPMTRFIKLRRDKYVQSDEWDGFAKFNESGSGIICLFKNHSSISDFEIHIDDLPDGIDKFTVKDVLAGSESSTVSAAELSSGIRRNWFGDLNCCILTVCPLK
jgi:alpha-galactosidase